jgi:AraC-like DNA-binding protein
MSINFVKEQQYNQVFFRYSRGPSLRKGHEIHPHHEIIYYIDGDATFISRNSCTVLKKNTLIFVPKGCFHNFDIKQQDNYLRLTISFPDIPILDEVLMEISDIIVTRNADVINFAKTIVKTIDGAPFTSQALSVYASFLSLMSELTRHQGASIQPKSEKNALSRCIAFIDEHFTENITVSDLAKKYFVSKSFLFTEFKKTFGISIHKYITQRRMIYAKSLLDKGNKPTDVYSACGYSDYSTFYKAFKNEYGISPREFTRL